MKNWIIPELDKQKIRELQALYGLPVFTCMLLTIRGITTKEEIERFLNFQSPSDDPSEIKDMKRAANRITNAVMHGEKICVYGDFDCDGISATAMLYSYLESVFADVMYYIPDRNSEGYGMNIKAVDYLHKKGVKLIITVDNGILAIDEIDYARSLFMDVVVTDHHKPKDILPRAYAVVDPHRSDETCRYRDYCGAGLVLKLLCALENDSDMIMENYLELAAIATVADLVPLTGENRDIVKQGLVYLGNSERIGLNELVNSADVKKLNAGAIGFKIGPRINAAGRLGSPYDALDILLTENEMVASERTVKLNKLNSLRQELEEKIMTDIDRMLMQRPELMYKRVIILSSPDWNPGVVGIAANKVVEKYGKPAILISETNDVCKGSGRSVAGFSLVDAVFACSKKLLRVGGHPMAVGLSIKREDIDSFINDMDNYANSFELMPLLALRIDTSLNPEVIDFSMLEQIEAFEPFGIGNPTPVFAITNAALDKITPVGNGNHLKLSVSRKRARINIMKFFTKQEEFQYSEGMILDIAVTMEKNSFRGVDDISFIAKDIRLSRGSLDYEKLMYEIQNYDLFLSGVFRSSVHGDKLPVRDEFKVVYIYLLKKKKTIFSVDFLLYEIENCRKNIMPELQPIGAFKLLFILDMMKELGFIDYKRCVDRLEIVLKEVKEKRDIASSALYKKLKEEIGNAG